jgi:17beta-estradiol 17-dehydrogenase / very-long-chain 3-oxoacyl-CoA reductase
LEAVAKEIEEEFAVETLIIDVDFTSGIEIYDKIKERIQGKEIGVLINNVGVAYQSPDYFLGIPNREKMIQDLVRVNVLSIPMMCSIVLGQMVERKRGLVINISSLSAIIPAACLTIYSGTKAFAHKFSSDLAMEYEKYGIVVQSVLPGPVATNMTKMRKPTWMAPSAKNFVESALSTVESTRHTTGYFSHSMLHKVTNLMLYFAPSFGAKTVLKTMENVRNRAIKRGHYQSATN